MVSLLGWKVDANPVEGGAQQPAELALRGGLRSLNGPNLRRPFAEGVAAQVDGELVGARRPLADGAFHASCLAAHLSQRSIPCAFCRFSRHGFFTQRRGGRPLRIFGRKRSEAVQHWRGEPRYPHLHTVRILAAHIPGSLSSCAHTHRFH